jgi:hypothetical protein
MRELRLGDIIDDFCVKCRRLTNHAIVSLMNGAAAKVRCRTCYSDHDYRNEIAPPTKKELLKQKELYEAVLAGVTPAAAPLEGEPVIEEAAQPVPVAVETLQGAETPQTAEGPEAPEAVPAKKKKAKAKA